MQKIIIKLNNVPKIWVFGIVFIYGLIMAEYFNNVSSKIFEIQSYELTTNPIYSYFISFNFVLTLLIAFVIWLLSSFLFHLFAILLGGDASFNDFKKYTGLCYTIPAIGFLISYILFEKYISSSLLFFLKSLIL